MAQTATLRALAEPLLRGSGLELWDVEVARDVVRFLVDRDGGVDLGALGEASRALSGLLDEHEELVPSGQYQLEISSPGLERTLRTPDQYRRYVGTPVSVKTAQPVHGGRRHRGVLAAVTGDGVDLTPDDAPGEVRHLAFAEIERARTVFVWESTPKPGGARAGARSKSASPAARRPPAAPSGQPGAPPAARAGAPAAADTSATAAPDPKDQSR